MKTLVHLTESDFEYETRTGEIIPVIDFGEDSEYYITYGHIPEDEMGGYVRNLITEQGENPDDTDYWGSLDDISWKWAIAYDSPYDDDEYRMKWEDIDSETEGAFPVTILSVW